MINASLWWIKISIPNVEILRVVARNSYFLLTYFERTCSRKIINVCSIHSFSLVTIIRHIRIIILTFCITYNICTNIKFQFNFYRLLLGIRCTLIFRIITCNLSNSLQQCKITSSLVNFGQKSFCICNIFRWG